MRLENLCLSYIIENFNVFNFAYFTSNDASIQRSLEFLQRIYSADLMKMFKPRQLKPEFVKFLVNRHLRELDFGKFRSFCWEEVAERATEIANGLVKVFFNRGIICKYPLKVKEIIGLLQNVKYLYIAFGCDNETIKSISTCENLKELHFGYENDIGDEGDRSFCRCRFESYSNIRRQVFLKHAMMVQESIAFILKNMPSLKIFNCLYLSQTLYSLHRNDLIIDKLETVKKYSLTELDFCSMYPSEIEEFLIICSVLCPNVTKLSCGVCVQEHIDLLSDFPKLEHIALHTLPNRRSITLDDFLKTKGGNLTSLCIMGQFSVSASVLLENCQRLEKLRLKYVDLQSVKHLCSPTSQHLEDFDLQNKKKVCIPTLKHLKELVMYTSESPRPLIADTFCSILNSSPNIEYLCVLYNGINDSQLKNTILSYCQRNILKYICLGFSGVYVDFLVLILKLCESLQRVNVRFCSMSKDQFARLIQTASATKNKPEIIYNDFKSIVHESDVFDTDESSNESF